MYVSLRERNLDVVLVERIVYGLLHLACLAKLLLNKHPIGNK